MMKVVIVGIITLLIILSSFVFFIGYEPTSVDDEPAVIESTINKSTFNDTDEPEQNISEWREDNPDRWVWNETIGKFEKVEGEINE